LGCVDSISKTVSIYPRPRVSFTPYPYEGCEPLFVTFTNNTTIPGNNTITNYVWNFGNGQTSFIFSPTQTYPFSGTYTVSLYANSDKNCDTTVTYTDTIKVYDLPNAEFEFTPENPTTANPVVEFINLSTGNPVNFYWDMGQGSTYQSQHVVHGYPADTGTYLVYLWVETQYGCSDSIYHPIRINSDFTVYIPNTFTPTRDGLNETFRVYGKGIVECRMLIFDRWGELLAEYKNLEPMTKGWDGKYNEVNVKQDIYVYRVIVRDFYGEYHEFRGNVNLLR
jgi:gliding motility-associated-like protein